MMSFHSGAHRTPTPAPRAAISASSTLSLRAISSRSKMKITITMPDTWPTTLAFRPESQAAALNIQASVRLPDVKLTTFYESLFLIRIHVVRPDGTPLSYKEGCGVMVDSVDRDSLSYHINHALEEDGTYTFGYIPAGKYQVRTYFQPDYRENPPKPFAEAAKWKPAVRDVTVSANTEVVIRLEPTEAR
jgi:hypothetical protein